MQILGISAFYHDSAAALIKDGEIIAAAQEERFSRIKHDKSFPKESIKYCLEEAGISLSDVDAITFYDKPLLKFERLLETYIAYSPSGLKSFLTSMPIWLKEKLFTKQEIKKELSALSGIKKNSLPKLLFTGHHQSHAASCFYPSPFEEASILCLDGVGEWDTASIWHGSGNSLTQKWSIKFPHSLGLLYSAFTYYCGFKVNSGEYKLMGLAPYGKPKYVEQIKNNLIHIKEDGTFRLNLDYFDYPVGLVMISPKFRELFGRSERAPESDMDSFYMDIAASIQLVIEEVVLLLASTVYKEQKIENLCLAGGVALNCVANGKLLKDGPFKKVWIQPAAGDAGGALGSALECYYQYYSKPRNVNSNDQMKGAYLGPSFSFDQIKNDLDSFNANYLVLEEHEIIEKTSDYLNDQAIIGWFQGRMEFGPRALGHRSILADARSSQMQSKLNLKIKYRESFRPFAPIVLEENCSEYFDIESESPYMLLVANVKKDKRIPYEQENTSGFELLKQKRSEVSAITHVDYSARIQTISKNRNPIVYKLLNKFKEKTQCPILINTSFNVRGEPIVCSPKDAYLCFMRTEMDYLIIDNFILDKKMQPKFIDDNKWKENLILD